MATSPPPTTGFPLAPPPGVPPPFPPGQAPKMTKRVEVLAQPTVPNSTILYQMRACIVELCGVLGLCTNVVNDQTVVKSGEAIKIEESHALRLAEQLHLPVPHVHEAQTTPDGGASTRMDYISGDNLKDVWPSMTPDQKHDIAIQLRDIIDKMRSLPSESNAIRSCSGGGIRDLRSYFDYSGGPFPDEESFNSFVLDFRPTVTPDAILRGLNALPTCNHRLTFCHADLSQHNLIVRDNKIVGLIDWEFAGWFPEYWEYVKLFERPSLRDWFNYSDVIFSKKYDKELMEYQAIIRWQRR